jgi:hypothetical protein
LGSDLSLFNKLISREAPLIIFEGKPGERAYLARLIISRFGGAEILCENPLIMRIPRSSSIEEVEEFIVSLKGIGNAAARISTNGEEIHRCLDGGEKVMMVSEHDPVSPRPWRKGFLAIKLKLCISRNLGNIILEKGETLAKYMSSNPLIKIASMAIPSAISTIGRFINDANMMIVGTAISGSLFAFQSISFKRARKKV